MHAEIDFHILILEIRTLSGFANSPSAFYSDACGFMFVSENYTPRDPTISRLRLPTDSHYVHQQQD